MQSAWADRTMNDLVLQEMNENHEIREMTKTEFFGYAMKKKIENFVTNGRFDGAKMACLHGIIWIRAHLIHLR